MPHIVDGYNLLRWIQSSNEEYAMLEEAGLCRLLCQYLGRIGDRGHIYFDGIGPPDKTELGGLAGLEVYFSGTEKEADDLIEEKISDNTAPRRLIVVSDDRRIRKAAQQKKAVSVRCEPFWMMIQNLLGRGTLTREPKEKRTGISQLETDQWMDFFGIDD